MEANQGFGRQIWVNLLTVTTFALAGACLLLEFRAKDAGVLLLTLVILGTGYDFLEAALGPYTKNRSLMLMLARTRFSLLNFGIIFTPLCAAFILNRLAAPRLCSRLVSGYLYWLVFSLVTGVLFMFTRYRVQEEDGMISCKLDRTDGFTRFSFIVRRVVLVCSLVIAVLVVWDGVQTTMAVWTFHFAVLFIATIPLHILHKEIPSMAIETATLIVLLYGAAKVY